jgi:Ca-activated chloride channel family protein
MISLHRAILCDNNIVNESISFQWPWAFLLLVLIPLWVFGYANYQRDYWRRAFDFSVISTVSHLKRQPSGWRRLWTPGLQLLVFLLMVVSLARPTIQAMVPTHSVDMMVVLDISLSMMAEDIRPNRLKAATDDGIRFVQSLPPDARVGLELFAGSPVLVSPPTEDHRKIIAYLKTLTTQDLQLRTEIGTAILSALQTLKLDRLSEEPTKEPTHKSGAGEALTEHPTKPEQVIVLLSDGDSREGYPWDQAAQKAKDQHVAIYTVGIGGAEPTSIVYQGQVLPVSFNESILHQIATIAQGAFFRVFTEKDLSRVYREIAARTLHLTLRPQELSVYGVLAALLCWVLSWLPVFRWFVPKDLPQMPAYSSGEMPGLALAKK